MSHYTKIDTQIIDRESLIKTLEHLGYRNVEVHDQPANLYGYQGDLRPEQANVIIRRDFIGRASNDIGFRLLDNGTYEAIVSDWDIEILGNDWVNRVCKNYAYHVVVNELESQGYRIDKQDGNLNSGKEKVHLVLRKS